MIRFSPPYLIVAALLFAVMAFIAAFVTGPLRTHGGDVLVVAFLYAGLRGVSTVSSLTAAVSVLLFAAVVELSQAFGLLEKLGLADVPLLRVIAGTSFDPLDFVGYGLGGLIAFVADAALHRKFLS